MKILAAPLALLPSLPIATGFGIVGEMVHVAGDDQQCVIDAVGQDLRQTGCERLTSFEIRLSNLMALDAVAAGNWGCLPEHYPAVLDLVLAGRVALEPFVEYRPMSSINESFADIHARRISRRLILLPES